MPKGNEKKPNGQGWIDCINSDLDPANTIFAVVIIQRPE